MKKMPKRKEDKTEQIELLRGGSVVSSLTGAFGKKVRETRLTAILGYLMALEPKPFLEKFGFEGTASSISLESKEENNRNEENRRSDIRVETTKGKKIIIEAKVGWKNPREQALKMKADWYVLLTQHMPTRREEEKIDYIRWEDIGKLLNKLAKSTTNRMAKCISEDLLKYLEENGMIKPEKITEIYTCYFARKESYSLNIFLEAHLYCENLRGDVHLRRLSKARYFAPNFCKNICKDNIGIQPGISYIAEIKNAEPVDSWKDLQEAAQRAYGKSWDKNKKLLIEPLYRKCCNARKKKQFFLFLSKPLRVFNPPVPGSVKKRGEDYLTFEKLFSTWQGGKQR